MHIELTDHLRCPNDHEESFLVMLPERMEERRVIAGHLGCHLCGWSCDWNDGIPDLGDGKVARGVPGFDASAALAMLGLEGPGGWVALVGRVASWAHQFGGLLPDVALVAVNPPQDVEPGGAVSVIRSERWPIKQHSMRGIVLGLDSLDYLDQAAASLLPGLRIAGEGDDPATPSGTILVASAPGAWVMRRG